MSKPPSAVPESDLAVEGTRDLLVVPAGIGLAVKLIPEAVLAEHRQAAARRFADGRRGSWTGAVIVLTIWLVALAWLTWVLWPILRD